MGQKFEFRYFGFFRKRLIAWDGGVNVFLIILSHNESKMSLGRCG